MIIFLKLTFQKKNFHEHGRSKMVNFTMFINKIIIHISASLRAFGLKSFSELISKSLDRKEHDEKDETFQKRKIF